MTRAPYLTNSTDEVTLKRPIMNMVVGSLAVLGCASIALADDHGSHDNHGGPNGHPPGHNLPQAGGGFMHPGQQQHMAAERHWRNGDRYDGNRHVVGDWNHYHLHQPPQGYEWVQDGNQLVLIAVASGIIAQVLANSAYQ